MKFQDGITSFTINSDEFEMTLLDTTTPLDKPLNDESLIIDKTTPVPLGSNYSEFDFTFIVDYCHWIYLMGCIFRNK